MILPPLPAGVDDRQLLAVQLEAIPDAAAQRAVLADNPAKLYGFP